MAVWVVGGLLAAVWLALAVRATDRRNEELAKAHATAPASPGRPRDRLLTPEDHARNR
jgi:hypothetical protein